MIRDIVTRGYAFGNAFDVPTRGYAIGAGDFGPLVTQAGAVRAGGAGAGEAFAPRAAAGEVFSPGAAHGQ